MLEQYQQHCKENVVDFMVRKETILFIYLEPFLNNCSCFRPNCFTFPTTAQSRLSIFIYYWRIFFYMNCRYLQTSFLFLLAKGSLSVYLKKSGKTQEQKKNTTIFGLTTWSGSYYKYLERVCESTLRIKWSGWMLSMILI